MARYELALLSAEGEPARFPVKVDGCFIGRSDTMDIPVEGKTVSRRHVRLWEESGTVCVEDLSSRNGICVNGERVRNARLKGGDQLVVGQNFFYVLDTTQPAPAAWPLPVTFLPPDQPAASTTSAAEPSQAGTNGSSLTHLTEDSEWCKYLVEPEVLQRKLAAAAVGATSATRAYVLTGAAGPAPYRILSAHSKTGNPDGPPLNETIIDRVLRSKKTVLVEGGLGSASSGAAGSGVVGSGALCVPLMGFDRCVGAIYADGGLRSASFTVAETQQLEAFGKKAGRLLQTAASIKTIFAQKKQEGVRDAAEANARSLQRVRSSVSGVTGLLKSGDGTSSPACEALVRSARRIESLQASNDALGRSDAIESSPMDIAGIVETATVELASLAQEAHVRLRFDRNGRIIAYADERDAAGAVTSLIRNAIECTPTGGEIVIRTENRIDGCYVSVTDSGAGLPPALKTALDSGRDLLAFGVGLASVHAIAQRNRGQLRAQPNRPTGTTITLVLPQRE